MLKRHEEPVMVTRSSLPPLEEYVEMLKPIWDSAWLTNMGEYHETLKEKLKTYLKTPNLELFVNGHMALELTLQAMKLTGEVITTPFSFASTTHAIVRNGLTPVFCDINEEDYTIDEHNLEDAAAAGVDVISIGALTHSVKALDISLDVGEIK